MLSEKWKMGKGVEAIVNFCQIMNMLRPFMQTAYDRCLDELHCSIQAEVNDSLQKVTEKTYAENRSGDNENDLADCTVSLDGSWQTRGLVPFMVL